MYCGSGTTVIIALVNDKNRLCPKGSADAAFHMGNRQSAHVYPGPKPPKMLDSTSETSLKWNQWRWCKTRRWESRWIQNDYSEVPNAFLSSQWPANNTETSETWENTYEFRCNAICKLRWSKCHKTCNYDQQMLRLELRAVSISKILCAGKNWTFAMTLSSLRSTKGLEPTSKYLLDSGLALKYQMKYNEATERFALTSTPN